MLPPSSPGPAFCSICGSPTHRVLVPEEDREREVCDTCGHIHYVNPKIVTGTIPIHIGKVWLLRRAIEPRYGYWTHPAGFMEMHETVEEGAARETLEELALRVRVRELLGVYSRAPMSTVHIVYLADALDEPSGGKETLEFAAFSPDTIPWNDLAFWSTHRALRDWLSRTK